MILGHDDAIATLLGAVRSGRFSHAWLLAGPEGVGKASVAIAAARRLLAEAAGPAPAGEGLETPAEHRILSLIDAGSHPDFAHLTRLPSEKTGKLAGNITVDQVRRLQRLFATRPSFSDLRVIVIDAADDLQREGANTLLKNLEEPPPGTLFLLVSHAPGRLLPTIRSRCRLLRFGALDHDAMTRALGDALPEADAAEIAALVEAGEGAPGRALRFAGLDIAALDKAMDRLIATGDRNGAERAALSRALAAKAAQPRYEAFLERAPMRIARAAAALHGGALADAIDRWERARRLSDGAVALSLDPQATAYELATHLAALAPLP